jgi:carboxyl-terminal processing protease
MRRTRLLAVTGLLLVPAIAGGFIYQDRVARDGAVLFDQVLTLVSQRFVDTVDAGALYEKAARGLLEELKDPYSELYTPEQLKQFEQNTGGRYGGLGMQIELVPNRGVTVSKVFPNTPAEASGILEGDIIVQIDDTLNARDWSSERVSQTLTGEPGTQVKVSFARQGVPQPIEVQFTRAVIHIPAVPYALKLDDRVGYVRLQGFNETAAEEVATSVRNLTGQGATGIVLDLRGNPGGYLQQALAISNLFLPQGREIASVRGRGTPPEHYVARERPVAPDVPLVILIDQGSASASEIVAGALQDHDRAVILGETSFGKGLVQTLFPLDGGYAVKLTTAKWFTPVGRSIQKERQLTSDGRWVEIYPDTLPADSLRRIRPVYRSSAGRIVYGGGAITPDEIVPADTLTTAEQALGRALAPASQDFFQAIAQIAYERKDRASVDTPVSEDLREELYQRLRERDVTVDREIWNGGASYVDRLLQREIVRRVGGDSAMFRLQAPEDVQLQRAIQYLRRGETQRDLFAMIPARDNR